MANQTQFNVQEPVESVESYEFEPIQGYPMLRWKGKRSFESTQYYPAQLKETYGDEVNNWRNKIYWGDNLQVMSHLLKTYRGKINLIYIDPPFDSKADYKKIESSYGEKPWKMTAPLLRRNSTPTSGRMMNIYSSCMSG